MKKLSVLLLCLLMLCSCAAPAPQEQKQYTATFLSLFDTVTTIVGRADSEEAFQATVQPIREELARYHRLFDIYEDYEGLNNLKTLNDHAAEAPVEVDAEIMALLQDCLRYYKETSGRFNPAMGAVLSLWHEAREDGINDPANAYLPDPAALREAGKHLDPANILLDTERSTVFFADPALKIDVGAIAKGWAVQRICAHAPSGLLISVGGNVYATGPKTQEGSPWAVGIQSPGESDHYLHILNVKEGSVVTSGSYHRAYAVDGKLYHHIIDPDTLYPGELWSSVSIVCDDSGMADVLATALLLLDQQKGQALLDRFGAHAMWVDTAGNKYYSPDFRELIRN